MSVAVPRAQPGMRVLEGPERVGSEQRWRVQLANGEPALLGQLLPELAADEALRRRYVRDVERLRDVDVEGLARILAFGPQPDPRAPDGAPPWRLRADPPGETLEAWLMRRAPAPIDEVARIIARLADIVHRVHGHGAVLRDLHPRWVRLGEDASVWLTDVGLARVDILSTRTAASLILEGSPYASPEQLRHTTLDQRSDLFGLGVMLYQGMTGSLPFGDGPALLREVTQLLSARELRPEIPAAIDQLITDCLSEDPRKRPESALSLVLTLRGEAGTQTRALARVRCQNCGETLRPGQRLCLSCGKQAVVFQHSLEAETATKELRLTKASEDAEFLARLRGFLASVSDQHVPALNFVIGDQRMYSKRELSRRIKLPVCLFTDLDEPTAEALRARMTAEGFQVKVADRHTRPAARKQRRILGGLAGTLMAATVVLAVAAAPVVAISVGMVGAIGLLTAYLIMKAKRKKKPRPGMLRLRPAPAALPASDPLVSRLAALLDASAPADVRDQVGELALLVQRLVDHRAGLRAEKAELDMVTEPVEPLVKLIETRVRAVATIDAELSSLEEGAIVRALAASEARGEPRSARMELLDGLDRLRALEEQRATAFHRLLEASTLLRRAVDLGLSVKDPAAEHERNVALALRALEGD